jgi:hypothetical protein
MVIAEYRHLSSSVVLADTRSPYHAHSVYMCSVLASPQLITRDVLYRARYKVSLVYKWCILHIKLANTTGVMRLAVTSASIVRNSLKVTQDVRSSLFTSCLIPEMTPLILNYYCQRTSL